MTIHATQRLSDWQSAPSELPLDPGDVHVWRARLVPIEHERIAACAALLTPDERDRAAAYRFPRDAQSFTARRAILRILIGRYLAARADPRGRCPAGTSLLEGVGDLGREAGCAPSADSRGKSARPYLAAFRLNPFGRPELPPDLGTDLVFSVSHSNGAAMFAFARGRSVGVDIEAMREVVDYCGIAERCFSPAERSALASLAPGERRRAFFAGWARKEAYIKARGLGLSIPLDSFDVSVSPGEPVGLISTRDPADREPAWTLAALDAGPGFSAALAVSGVVRQAHLFEWRLPGTM
ncbi:MAG TPA: 4'-phosphopantetheinyl transferase superfamily protein [Chloroflexota bacterium]|nr:4'-phosphopantetheinyl transferase superfamily protein [Chloroflexota bacterium]